jgi:hypothetical protein
MEMVIMADRLLSFTIDRIEIEPKGNPSVRIRVAIGWVNDAEEFKTLNSFDVPLPAEIAEKVFGPNFEGAFPYRQITQIMADYLITQEIIDGRLV